MDSRGGCCIARYVGGGAYDKSKVDRIMLRFRPIAPKPINTDAVSGNSKPEVNDVVLAPRNGRGKRKYVRSDHFGTSNNNNSKTKCNKVRRSSPETDRKVVTTLPLLPETPELKISPERTSDPVVEMKADNYINYPVWLSLNQVGLTNYTRKSGWLPDLSTVVMPPLVRMISSCVTVESITDTWMEGDYTWGCTDEERRRNLEVDTCPGFTSDGAGRVTWTNEAYRKMVGQGEELGIDDQDHDTVVWLVMKDLISLPIMATAFTCRVRLQYTCRKERGTSQTLPCDVWRMEGGGFAWRLDVKAALKLGR